MRTGSARGAASRLSTTETPRRRTGASRNAQPGALRAFRYRATSSSRSGSGVSSSLLSRRSAGSMRGRIPSVTPGSPSWTRTARARVGERVHLLPGLPIAGLGLDLERLLDGEREDWREPRRERLARRPVARAERLGYFDRGVLGAEERANRRRGDPVDLRGVLI